jgi:hypothetical protein
MKRLSWSLVVVTFLAAAAYSIVSLNRWQWSRALYFGLVALVAEIAIATGLVLRKLARTTALARANEEQIAAILREVRRPQERFAWLRPESMVGRMNVFIALLVGGGVILSALAWVVDRIAANTAQPIAEGRLARDLATIDYPEGGLLVDDVTAMAQTAAPHDDRQLRALLGRSG